MIEQVLKKLEDAFTWGATDAQACRYADISHQTLYNYCKSHPEFLERKEQLKGMIKMRAQKVIEEELGHDDEDFNIKRVNLAMWVLEKGAPHEFGDTKHVAPPLPLNCLSLSVGTHTQNNLIRADEMTDDQLQRLAHGESIQKVLEGKMIAYAPKS